MSEYNYNLRGSSDTVFKIPTVPSRPRRPNYNNTTGNTQNVETASALKKVEEKFEVIKEKFEVIKKICTPEEVESILENVMNGFHSVCYEKVAEQIRSSSQASSVFNGGVSACPSVCSVNVRQSGPSRNNYGTSALNVHDTIIPDRFSRQNFSTQINGDNYVTHHAPHNGLHQNYSAVNDIPQGPFSVPMPKSRPVMKNVRQRKLPEIVQRSITEESESDDEDQEEISRIPVGLSVPAKRKREVPVSTPVRKLKPTSTTAAPSRKDKQTLVAVSTKKDRHINIPVLATENVTNIIETEPKNELRVLPSDDESDSLSMFFKGKKKTLSKPSPTKATNESSKRNCTAEKATRRFSVSLSRVDLNTDSISRVESSDAQPRKRKAMYQDEGPSNKKQASSSMNRKDKDPSPDTTTQKLKTTRRITAAASRKPKRKSIAITSRKTKTSLPAKSKSAAGKKKQTVKSKTQEEDKNIPKVSKPTLANGTKQTSMVGFDQQDHGSFFGDVSSIVGIDSLHLSQTVVRNPSKHSSENRNEMPSHMFSPFANMRSTSGLSAVSTPLSKTLSKNVLGKRLKKPSVVAELKDQLVRKPRKKTVVQKHITPIEDSSHSESEDEISDFSDN